MQTSSKKHRLRFAKHLTEGHLPATQTRRSRRRKCPWSHRDSGSSCDNYEAPPTTGFFRARNCQHVKKCYAMLLSDINVIHPKVACLHATSKDVRYSEQELLNVPGNLQSSFHMPSSVLSLQSHPGLFLGQIATKTCVADSSTRKSKTKGTLRRRHHMEVEFTPGSSVVFHSGPCHPVIHIRESEGRFLASSESDSH